MFPEEEAQHNDFGELYLSGRREGGVVQWAREKWK